ncbi:pro-resilin-like [Diaphorina citri]|uniref:Pro-resilin-like n=1 Tax=Diaphorina citri TaxID=121845 RepID=A0A1S3CX47_DIACI|nr:pro-resilin-like [Diaphorina citri]
MQKVLCSLLFVSFVALVSCRPQVEDPAGEKPSPYQFEYKVEDQPNTLYFGANENGNEAGRVEGKYYVLLPDGRLMTVNYYVDTYSLRFLRIEITVDYEVAKVSERVQHRRGDIIWNTQG